MVVADQNANPVIIAADLLAQAEHDMMAQVVLVSFSENLINAVKREVEIQLQFLSRENIARVAMKKAVYILVSSHSEAVGAINQYAPEHLIVNVEDPENIVPLVRNAGSIFVGPYSPESVGDYASGTNHVLPTSGFARNYSGLGTTSFMKSITLQTLTKEGLQAIGPTVEHLAYLEGLDAHAQAVTKRLALINSEKKL
jgi:histidinol dehydrogenase